MIEHARLRFISLFLLLTSRSHLDSGHKASTAGELEGFRLLNARSTALDENAQHNDKENTGYYTDNGYAFHDNPPSSANDRACSTVFHFPVPTAYEPFSP